MEKRFSQSFLVVMENFRRSRYLPVETVEPFIEFLGAEAVFLSTVALHRKGSTYTAHHGALRNALAPDETADQASPVRIAGACRVLYLPRLHGGNTDFTVRSNNL